VRDLLVTNRFLSVLGVMPVLGRAFTASDDDPGNPSTVILTPEGPCQLTQAWNTKWVASGDAYLSFETQSSQRGVWVERHPLRMDVKDVKTRQPIEIREARSAAI
jgi:hypothetical protein